jgi:AAA15 family ATPase/GTPase
VIYLQHKRLGRAPLSVFGDALRRVVLLAGTILSLRAGGILLLDEVETGLHVSVLERVFRWTASISRQQNVQVVATTQSLEAVDAMAASAAYAKPDLVAFHLNQTAEDTLVRRIDAEMLLRLRRERALDVR